MNKYGVYSNMQRINGWIEQHPEVTEPNMYEMIECLTDLGILAKEGRVAETPSKFPDKASDLTPVYEQWNSMCQKRFNYEMAQDPNYPANRNTSLYHYFADLNMRCCIGEFRYPEDENEREEFQELLKKIGSVSLYINQEKLKDPNFKYNNPQEYDSILNIYEKYKDRDDCYISREAVKVIDEIGQSREYTNGPKAKDDNTQEI